VRVCLGFRLCHFKFYRACGEMSFAASSTDLNSLSNYSSRSSLSNDSGRCLQITSGATAPLGITWSSTLQPAVRKVVPGASPNYQTSHADIDWMFLKNTHSLFGSCSLDYLLTRYTLEVRNESAPGQLLQLIPPLKHAAINKGVGPNWLKLYLDVEEYIVAQPTSEAGQAQVSRKAQQEFIKKVVKHVETGIREATAGPRASIVHGNPDDLECAVKMIVADNASRWIPSNRACTSSSDKEKFKLSFHLVWPMILFKGKQDMKKFLEKCRERSKPVLDCVDLAVYAGDKSFQALSLPWSAPQRYSTFRNIPGGRIPWDLRRGEPLMFDSESDAFTVPVITVRPPPGIKNNVRSCAAHHVQSMSREEFFVAFLVSTLQLGSLEVVSSDGPRQMFPLREELNVPVVPTWMENNRGALCIQTQHGDRVHVGKQMTSQTSTTTNIPAGLPLRRRDGHDDGDRRKPPSKSSSSTTLKAFSGLLASSLVPLLSRERATDYSTWCQVGWALHSVFSDPCVNQDLAVGMKLFDTFSQTTLIDDQYNQEACKRIFLQGSGQLSIGSLIAWAKSDAGENKVTTVRRDARARQILNSHSSTHAQSSVHAHDHERGGNNDIRSASGSTRGTSTTAAVNTSVRGQRDRVVIDESDLVHGGNEEVLSAASGSEQEDAEHSVDDFDYNDVGAAPSSNLDAELDAVVDSLSSHGNFHDIHRQNFDGRVIQILLKQFKVRWAGFTGEGEILDDEDLGDDSSDDVYSNGAVVSSSVDVDEPSLHGSVPDHGLDWPYTVAGFRDSTVHVKLLIVTYMNRFFVHVTGGSAAEIVETSKSLTVSEIWSHRQFTETKLHSRSVKNTREIYQKYNFLPPWDSIESSIREQEQSSAAGSVPRRSSSRGGKQHPSNKISPFTLWGNHPQGKECRTLTFNPNPGMDQMNDVNKAFNLFTGLGVPHPLPPDDTVPTVSRESLEEEIAPFLHHLRNIVCNEEAAGPNGGAKFRWLLKVLAMKYKQPWKRLEVVIVLIGKCGSGKTYLGHLLGYLLGQEHYIHRVGGDALKEQFSLGQRAMKNMFTFLDEFHQVTEAERNKFKGLITQPEKEHNEKYVSKIILKNFTTYMVASNSVDCLRIEDAERRFCIFNTLSTYAGAKTETNCAYFHKLWAVKPERVALYLFHYVNLDSFDPRQLPHTAEGQTFRESLLTPTMQGLCEMLHLGSEYGSLFDGHTWHVKDTVWKQCVDLIQQRGQRDHSANITQILFWKEIGRVFDLPRTAFKRIRVGVNVGSTSNQRRCVLLPSLQDARTMFLHRGLDISESDIMDGTTETWQWRTTSHLGSRSESVGSSPASAHAPPGLNQVDYYFTRSPRTPTARGSRINRSPSFSSCMTTSPVTTKVSPHQQSHCVSTNLSTPPGLPIPSSHCLSRSTSGGSLKHDQRRSIVSSPNPAITDLSTPPGLPIPSSHSLSRSTPSVTVPDPAFPAFIRFPSPPRASFTSEGSGHRRNSKSSHTPCSPTTTYTPTGSQQSTIVEVGSGVEGLFGTPPGISLNSNCNSNHTPCSPTSAPTGSQQSPIDINTGEVGGGVGGVKTPRKLRNRLTSHATDNGSVHTSPLKHPTPKRAATEEHRHVHGDHGSTSESSRRASRASLFGTQSDKLNRESGSNVDRPI
jgi:hypothetical protein